MNPFMFQLGNTVTVAASGETGVVRSRAEHVASEPNYLVYYKGGDGRAVEVWWPQSTLVSSETSSAVDVA